VVQQLTDEPQRASAWCSASPTCITACCATARSESAAAVHAGHYIVEANMRKKKFDFYPGLPLKNAYPFTLEDIVCGVDEAGRGPLAGPGLRGRRDPRIRRVRSTGLRDSKKLSAERAATSWRR
jgi:hypothetical protein